MSKTETMDNMAISADSLLSAKVGVRNYAVAIIETATLD